MSSQLAAVSLIAVILYLASGGLLAARLSRGGAVELKRPKITPLALGLLAVALHATVLFPSLVTESGLNLGFYNAVSLLLWFIALLLLLASIKSPIENLGIALLPLAAIGLLLETFLPSEHVLGTETAMGLGIHILTSVLAYAVLTLAAAQALLLAIQDKHLRNRHPGGFIRALPPLETMESLLFQMIVVGFLLQNISLLSGFISLEDMFAQHQVHKTVFSIIAWGVFATLLWGHWRYGWRGRTAVRWTLIGFGAMLLAYVGSTLVQQVVLGR